MSNIYAELHAKLKKEQDALDKEGFKTFYDRRDYKIIRLLEKLTKEQADYEQKVFAVGAEAVMKSSINIAKRKVILSECVCNLSADRLSEDELDRLIGIPRLMDDLCDAWHDNDDSKILDILYVLAQCPEE